MAASGYNMLTGSPEACLAGPFVLTWLCNHGHHQCLRQGFVPHVARLATRTSFTSHGAMLLMRFALVPFFVAKLVIKNRSLRPYAQYVVPHSDFGCWLAQVLLVFTCWSAVLLHNDAEQESGNVAPCILVDAKQRTYNCYFVIQSKRRKCKFVLDNS